MTKELREEVATLLCRQTKLGESERTLVAVFLLDLLDEDADGIVTAVSVRTLMDECDEIASAAMATKTLLEQLDV